jgi:hypothetical protein
MSVQNKVNWIFSVFVRQIADADRYNLHVYYYNIYLQLTLSHPNINLP